MTTDAKPEPFTAWMLITPSGTRLPYTIAADDYSPFFRTEAFGNLGSIAEMERVGWRVIQVTVTPNE